MIGGLEIIVIIIFCGALAYISISQTAKFKKKNKPVENIIWKHTPIEYPLGSREGHILDLLNYERMSRSLKPFRADAKITSKSQTRTWEMDLSSEIDHTSAKNELMELKIDGSDGSADLIAYAYTYPASVVGFEFSFDNLENTIKNGWLGSTSHREAILNARYDYCGISSLKRTNGKWIDVLMLVDEKTVN